MNFRDLFLLDPEIAYLNHGSFGACPREVFSDYQSWQLILEREPVHFIVKHGLEEMKRSKAALADVVGCEPDNLVFVTNPTYAVNIIARSLPLAPGDEVLSTNHEYGAMDRTWNYYCGKAGAKYVNADITLPFEDEERIIEQFWSQVNTRTRVIFINHISSATALIFPVKGICDRARKMGIVTIVDGAHVPGHIPLNIRELQPDFYTGACHKWLLTPKGNSFLYTSDEWKEKLDPIIISWGYEAEMPGPSKFLDYHEQQGTRDFSAFLTVPAALRFFDTHQWDTHTAQCRERIPLIYREVSELAGTQPIADPTFLGQMCSVRIHAKDPQEVKNILFEKFRIEIPVFKWRGMVFMRVSWQPYNTQDDLDRLLIAFRYLLDTGHISRP